MLNLNQITYDLNVQRNLPTWRGINIEMKRWNHFNWCFKNRSDCRWSAGRQQQATGCVWSERPGLKADTLVPPYRWPGGQNARPNGVNNSASICMRIKWDNIHKAFTLCSSHWVQDHICLSWPLNSLQGSGLWRYGFPEEQPLSKWVRFLY